MILYRNYFLLSRNAIIDEWHNRRRMPKIALLIFFPDTQSHIISKLPSKFFSTFFQAAVFNDWRSLNEIIGLFSSHPTLDGSKLPKSTNGNELFLKNPSQLSPKYCVVFIHQRLNRLFPIFNVQAKAKLSSLFKVIVSETSLTVLSEVKTAMIFPKSKHCHLQKGKLKIFYYAVNTKTSAWKLLFYYQTYLLVTCCENIVGWNWKKLQNPLITRVRQTFLSLGLPAAIVSWRAFDNTLFEFNCFHGNADGPKLSRSAVGNESKIFISQLLIVN